MVGERDRVQPEPGGRLDQLLRGIERALRLEQRKFTRGVRGVQLMKGDAVVGMVVALWLNDRFESMLFDVSYIAVGAAGIYWYSMTFYTQLPDAMASDTVWLALPKIALVMVAGAGVSAWSAVAWAVTGYATAETLALVSAAQVGARTGLDGYTFTATMIAIVAIVLSVVSRYRARKAQPLLHRAARDAPARRRDLDR